MKVNELMVGDWVNVNGLNLKVGAIHADEIGVVDPDYKIYWCSDDEFDRIDPIPLTEDILEKNGFKKESQTIDGDYCKYTLPGFALNWCDTDGFWYQNGDITPNHVHTLQHLLRLVGVQKEIEL